MTATEAIAIWGELTGERFRVLPYIVQTQAAQLANFTREEIALVVAYTRRMIAHEEGGFNAQSLTWRVMAENDWQKFQERLAAALKTKLAARYLAPAKPAAPAAPAPVLADEDEIRRKAAEGLRRFREGGAR